MDELADRLAARFEGHRDRLRAIARRMLGSAAEADDAVQEAWLRLARAGAVDNLGGWLTTVIGRICIDHLRTRAARREEPPASDVPDAADPERDAVLTDEVGAALLVVLDTLAPAERLAFVLHDLFAVPFAEIAPIIGRTAPATKMLASRARRRIRSATPPTGADPGRRHAVVGAFLAASRDGDFEALLAILDPDVTVRADAAAVPPGAPTRLRGAGPVARQALTFAGLVPYATPVVVAGVAGVDGTDGLDGLDGLDGAVGAAGVAVAPRGRLATVMVFTVTGGRIAAIEVIADPDRLARLTLRPAGGAPLQ